jgi:hypothetical protein
LPAPEIRDNPGAFPFGAFRRRVRVVATADDVVEGGLEDDFHYFKVTLRHDGERVVDVDTEAIRWPWTTCPDAAVPLRALAGMSLAPRCLAVGDWTAPRRNCTHLFDLAGLAVAQAARHVAGDGDRRQYDAEIPFGAQFGGEHAVRLWRDGSLVHEWTLDGRGCADPAPFSDVPWRGGFLRWADRAFPPEESEPVIVLRRACDIGAGRGMDLDSVERAAELAEHQSGICYTMQPDVVPVSLRNKGTVRDWHDHPDDLLGRGPA